MSEQPAYRPGDIANNHSPGEDGRWHPVQPAYPAHYAPAKKSRAGFGAGVAAGALGLLLVAGLVGAAASADSGATGAAAPTSSPSASPSPSSGVKSRLGEVEDNAWRVGIRIGAEHEFKSYTSEDITLMCEGYEYLEATTADGIADLIEPNIHELGLDAEIATLPDGITAHDALAVVGDVVVKSCGF